MASGDTNIFANPAEYYLHDLQFYKSYPIGNCQLSEIISVCLQRIDVLLLVNKIYTKIGRESKACQCKEILLSELKKINYDLFFNIINGPSKLEIQEEIRMLRTLDNISHFLLKTSCASQHKKWFIIQEIKLFIWRLSTLTAQEIRAFCTINKIKFYDISEQEKKDLEEFIKVNNLHKNMRFYKVPFQTVLDLVEQHKVFLKGGMAFVPEKELPGLCYCYFKENLFAEYNIYLNAKYAENAENAKNSDNAKNVENEENALLIDENALLTDENALLTDENDLLIDLQSEEIFDTINIYLNTKRGHVEENCKGPSVMELDSLLSSAYPLCMRLIHENLRKDHHLKHGARLQYILFLRSIGVSFQNAMDLWKKEFTKKMNVREFEKDHGYRLKYLYGKTQSQKNYSCYSCASIINFDVKPIERYGCPFKTLTNVALRKKLTEYEFELPDIEDIVSSSSSQNYQRACMKYYEATNNHFKDELFKSPSHYFRYIYNKHENNDDSS